MAVVRNPVLPGFHPDPCILRHGDWFYLATSTFEWWPGVQINRSRDLANWELAGYALTRTSQIDLRGVPNSGGVWAPALSFADGLFWLVYSNMRAFSGPFKDVRNYLITAPSIDGPWSEPTFLNASGFDPSLFHDEDGRKWLLNQNWLPTHDASSFDGIVIQEFSSTTRSLIGEPQKIFSGSKLETTEGPHLYRKDGYYYLVTAEGGTSWEHAVTVARARELFGPYEISPQSPLLTSAGDRDLALQKAGHGSFVRAADGHWYMAHLCSRPVPGTLRCILGRETAIQKLEWHAGEWPRLATRGHLPAADFAAPGHLARSYFEQFRDEFDGRALGLHWNTLREPASSEWLTLGERPGFLRLYGRHSIQSLFEQSLVGVRAAHHRFVARTVLSFAPINLQQRAGLALFYSSTNFYYLYVSRRDGQSFANVLACNNGQFSEVNEAACRISWAGPIELRATLRDAVLNFFVGEDERRLARVGGDFDATILSDDYPLETNAGWAFTGLFIALCAQDATAHRTPADFDCFSYEATWPQRGTEDAKKVDL